MTMSNPAGAVAVGGKEGPGKVSRMDFENPDPNTFMRTVKRKLVVEGKEEELPVGVFFKFRVIPPPIPMRNNGGLTTLSLASLIRSAGGVLCSGEEDADYALTVLDLWSLHKSPIPGLEVPHDTYSSRFIYQSIMNKKRKLAPPDPNEFLLTPSIYSPYDPLEILQRTTKWSALTVLEEPRNYPVEEVLAKLEQGMSLQTSSAGPERQVSTPPQSNANGEAVGTSVEVGNSSSPSTSKGAASTSTASPSPKKGSEEASGRSEDSESSPTNRILSSSFARTQRQLTSSKEKPLPTGRPENGNEDHRSGNGSLPHRHHAPSKGVRRVSSPRKQNKAVASSSKDNDAEETLDSRSKDATHQSDSDDSDVDHVPASKETPQTRSKDTSDSDDSEASVNSGATLALPSKGKLASSPKNPNRVTIREPIVLVHRALAGPSTSSPVRKQVKRSNRSETTKDNQRVDGRVQKKPIPDVEDSASGSDSEGSSVAYNSDDFNSSSHGEASKIGRRSPYGSYEDRLIVQKICDQGAIQYTKGKKMWILLAKSQEFKGKRTFGSLQNRWRRYILPRLLKQNNTSKRREFKISDTQLNQIQRMEKVTHNHDKCCPNFKF